MELGQVNESSQSNDQGFDEFLNQAPKAQETKQEAKEVKTKEQKTVEKTKSNVPGKDIPFNSPEEYVKHLEANEPKLDLKKFEDSEADELEENEQSDEVEEAEETFEVKHNGQVKKITAAEREELVSKGFDYTQKTQALANERKEFEAEKKSIYEELDRYSKELEAKTNQHDQRSDVMDKWDVTIDVIKENDPELFDKINQYFNHTVRQFDNPAIKRQFETYNKELKNVKDELDGYKSKEILSSFNKEMSETKENLGKALAQYGIFPDWDGKVTDQWKNSNMSIKSIVYALYGDQISAAKESKINLASTKAATINKPAKHSIAKKPAQQPKQLGRDNGYSRATDLALRAVGLK